MDTYQRGNRDGLLALAKWADDMAKVHKVDYEQIQEGISRNSLTALRYEGTVTRSIIRSEVYRDIAAYARRMAEALPIDPELPTQTD